MSAETDLEEPYMGELYMLVLKKDCALVYKGGQYDILHDILQPWAHHEALYCLQLLLSASSEILDFTVISLIMHLEPRGWPKGVDGEKEMACVCLKQNRPESPWNHLYRHMGRVSFDISAL